MHTPWGNSQYKKTLMRGVHEVSTAGHGGLALAQGIANKIMSQDAIRLGAIVQNGYCFFEEDCAINFVVYESKEVAELYALRQGTSIDEVRASALKSIARWYPQYNQKG